MKIFFILTTFQLKIIETGRMVPKGSSMLAEGMIETVASPVVEEDLK